MQRFRHAQPVMPFMFWECPVPTLDYAELAKQVEDTRWRRRGKHWWLNPPVAPVLNLALYFEIFPFFLRFTPLSECKRRLSQCPTWQRLHRSWVLRNDLITRCITGLVCADLRCVCMCVCVENMQPPPLWLRMKRYFNCTHSSAGGETLIRKLPMMSYSLPVLSSWCLFVKCWMGTNGNVTVVRRWTLDSLYKQPTQNHSR